MAPDTAAERGAATLDGLPAGRSAPAKKSTSVLPIKRRELEFDMADDLTAIDAPEELVEGLLTVGAMSVIYGDSNSGKTFLAVDIGMAIAQGIEWADSRRTVQGLVVYLAVESPQSVRTRAFAYQRERRVGIRLFAIVKSPVDLFCGDADTTAVVELVRELEAAYQTKVQLIIGDTLARLAAGANENSGEDMSIVVRNIDRIRSECESHFLLIHHTGKDATRGMRGWSGLRAATDTEIEVVSDQGSGSHAAEVTKQRDIPGKGTRIGFKLRVVELGRNKWHNPITSCVVVPTDAPEKRAPGRRLGEIGGAIIELLTSRGSGIKKREIVTHLVARYDKSSIYRELKHLVENGKVGEALGIVTIRGAT